MHINAFFDLKSKTYTDAVIQSFHKHDEFAAFCQIVDRHEVIADTKNIYIGDRGYCSYNNMAHVIETGQFFLAFLFQVSLSQWESVRAIYWLATLTFQGQGSLRSENGQLLERGG